MVNAQVFIAIHKLLNKSPQLKSFVPDYLCECTPSRMQVSSRTALRVLKINKENRIPTYYSERPQWPKRPKRPTHTNGTTRERAGANLGPKRFDVMAQARMASGQQAGRRRRVIQWIRPVSSPQAIHYVRCNMRGIPTWW